MPQVGQQLADGRRVPRMEPTIASPIDGRIGITKADVGEFVGRMPNPVVLNYVSQTNPISGWQLASQPSPGTPFPSSQRSNPAMMLSPQAAAMQGRPAVGQL